MNAEIDQSTLLKPDEKKVHHDYSKFSVGCILLFPALGGFLFGYDIGGTSVIIDQIKSPDLSGVDWFSTVKDSSFLQGALTSGSIFGAIIGSLVCFKIELIIGRKRELIFASVFYFIGAALKFASSLDWTKNDFSIAILLIGSIIYGLGIGFSMHGAPTYISEMSPSSVRGFMVGMKEVFVVTGILIGYLIGYIFRDTEKGWRYVALFPVFPAIILFIGMYSLPCSVRWLLVTGKHDNAMKSLEFIYKTVPLDILNDIEIAATSNNKEATFADLFRGMNKLAMIVGVGVLILQQITGQPSVLYYANTIFSDAGLSSLASVLLGSFKVVVTLCAVFRVEKYGRKKLLLVGSLLMLVALVVLGISFLNNYVSSSDCNELVDEASCTEFSDQCYFKDGCICLDLKECECCSTVTEINFQKGVILAAMFVYIGGYQVGFGPIGWILVSEIFPLETRGKAISVSVVANFVANLLVTFLFPVEVEYVGIGLTFLIFAFINLLAVYFIWRKVPETKGRSLEEIEKMFQRIYNINM